MRNCVFAFIAVMLVACGSREPGPSSNNFGEASANPALASLPATVEGELDMSLGEGDDGEGDAAMLFGGLKVGQEDLYIQVSEGLLAAAGISQEVTRVRATIALP